MMQRVTKNVVRILIRNVCRQHNAYCHALSICKPVCLVRYFSDTSQFDNSKILSLSTLLLQDGLDIRELPIIIRRTDQAMFPFSKTMLTVADVRKISQQENQFKFKLQDCDGVQEVFKLLEIPSDEVTGYFAAFALQRIFQLSEACVVGDNMISFICNAVMNELYDTVRSGIASLTNDTVISLVKCYLENSGFNKACLISINEEVEKRLIDNKFNIPELCTLSCLLQNQPGISSRLFDSIWIHIGSRFQDIDSDNISLVYSCLPKSHKYISELVDKKLKSFWWKLSGSDIANIIASFRRLHVSSRRFLPLFSKWSFINIHCVEETDLMQIIAGFIHFKYSDPMLIRSMERYCVVKRQTIDSNLMGLMMEYCRNRRLLSVPIFETAAEHFKQNGDSYSGLQLYAILRTFGYMNYVPNSYQSMFEKVESVLETKLSDMDVTHQVALLCSFMFIRRFPVNFIGRIMNPFFVHKVRMLTDRDQYEQTCIWMEMFRSSLYLETSGGRKPRYLHNQMILEFPRRQWPVTQNPSWCNKISTLLTDLVGEGMFKEKSILMNGSYLIDFVLFIDEDNKLISPMVCDLSDRRLALLVQHPEFFCMNTGRLLGQYAMRNRHLKLLGYTVLEIQFDIFRLLGSKDAKFKFLKGILQNHIDLANTTSHRS